MPVNITINELARTVFKKPVEECSIDELQQLAHEYPFFGPAQLLLAKKLQSEDVSLYEDQVQKTSLYFPNRVWLHHLLNEEQAEATPVNHPPVKEEKAIIEKTEPIPPTAFIETVVHEHKEIETVSEPIKEDIPEINVPVMQEQTQPTPTLQEQTTPSPHETIEPVVGQPTPPVTKLSSLKIEPLATGAGLTFEPYHTVDYFASQGIKFKEEEKPTDRFSQQLRSFTEWLKTMKRLPVSEVLVANTDVATERKVDQMAEHSIAERHVITEAMAEVWIKQGNTARAEEIYRKLSLLDPPKSSYFAAKIEELKKTS